MVDLSCPQMHETAPVAKVGISFGRHAYSLRPGTPGCQLKSQFSDQICYTLNCSSDENLGPVHRVSMMLEKTLWYHTGAPVPQLWAIFANVLRDPRTNVGLYDTTIVRVLRTR